MVFTLAFEQRESNNNKHVANWWQKYTHNLWLLMGVAGSVQTPGDDWKNKWHDCKTVQTNAESKDYWEGYSHSTSDHQNGSLAQSQTAQELNKESYRTLAKKLLEQNVRVSYYDIRTAMRFTKTNKTVRAVHDEMTKLSGFYEDPSLQNARWVREENYRANVKKAIEVLYFYSASTLHSTPNGNMTITYANIRSFVGAVNSNNTVRAIGAILEETRTNPWDANAQAYTLRDFVYYLVPLRFFSVVVWF